MGGRAKKMNLPREIGQGGTVNAYSAEWKKL